MRTPNRFESYGAYYFRVGQQGLSWRDSSGLPENASPHYQTWQQGRDYHRQYPTIFEKEIYEA